MLPEEIKGLIRFKRFAASCSAARVLALAAFAQRRQSGLLLRSVGSAVEAKLLLQYAVTLPCSRWSAPLLLWICPARPGDSLFLSFSLRLSHVLRVAATALLMVLWTSMSLGCLCTSI